MKRNKTMYITLLISMFSLAIVYAIFTSNIKINGTAQINSTWGVKFTSVQEVSKTSGITILEEPRIEAATTTVLSVGLESPGDTITYRITVENFGTINAIVNNITKDDNGNDAVSITVVGIAKGDLLNAGATDTFDITVTYKTSVQSQPADRGKYLELRVEYVQNLGQIIPGTGDSGSTLTPVTLSASGVSPSLTGSAGRALTSYRISGNSIQSTTPTISAPVYLDSVGQSKNLFDISSIPYYGSSTDKVNNAYVRKRSYNGNIWPIFNTNLSSMLNGETYTLSFDIKSSQNTTWTTKTVYINSSTTKSHTLTNITTSWQRLSVTFTYNSVTDRSSLLHIYPTIGSGIDIYIQNVQIEKGSTLTDYVPYNYLMVTSTGKNVFDSKNAVMSNASFDGEKWSINDKVYDRIVLNQYFVPKKDTDYTVVVDVLENTMNLGVNLVWDNRFYFENKSHAFPVGSTGRNIIHVHSRASYDNVTLGSLWFNSSKNIVGTFKFKIMILEGNVSTANVGEYEPYATPQTTIIDMTGHDPLRCIGSTCDYIDFSSKNIYRYVNTRTFTGSEVFSQWSTSTATTSGFYWASSTILGEYQHPTFASDIGTSSHFIKGSSAYAASDNQRVSFNPSSNPPYISFRVPYLTMSSFASFVAEQYKKGTPLIVYYQLLNPSPEAINLPSIATTYGTSKLTVTSSNGVPISNMEVSYYSMQ